MRQYENLIIAVVLLLLDGYWFKMTLTLPASASTTIYGPRFFPQVIMIGILLCSLIFLWKGLRGKKATLDEDLIKCRNRNQNKVIILMLLFLGYVVLFGYIGFFLSSVIYIILAQIIFGVRNKFVLFLVSPCMILLLNVLFVAAFKIPLP